MWKEQEYTREMQHITISLRILINQASYERMIVRNLNAPVRSRETILVTIPVGDANNN